jgi:hypothetical protein
MLLALNVHCGKIHSTSDLGRICSPTRRDKWVEELDQEKLIPLLRLKCHNIISDALADLGPAENIGHLFTGFQKYLYQHQTSV